MVELREPRCRGQLLGDDAGGFRFDLSSIFHQRIGHFAIALACATQVDMDLHRGVELLFIRRCKLVERCVECLRGKDPAPPACRAGIPSRRAGRRRP